MKTSEEWYNGKYAEYAIVPWIYELDIKPIMPWILVDHHPCGYLVFDSHGGTRFKMLRNPAIVMGDVIS